MANDLVVGTLRLYVRSTGSEPLVDSQDESLVDYQGEVLTTASSYDAVSFVRQPSISFLIEVTSGLVEFTVERRRVYLNIGTFLRTPRRLYPGSSVQVNGDFTDEDGIPFDPLTAELLISSPSRRLSSFTYGEDEEIRRTGDGRYVFDLTVDEPGRWVLQWRALAKDVTAIKEIQLSVQDTPHYQYPREAYAE